MRSAVMLAALALLAARAGAQEPAEPSGLHGLAGRYVADFTEAPPSLGWSSAIELKPDGTFLWTFATRELDLSARGSWCRDGPDRLDLTNEEAVGNPEVRLARSSRDGGEGVLVSLEPDSREAASHLGVEAEYPDGYHELFRFRDFQVRLPSSPQRPLVAVRLVSDAFTYRSWPIEVTRDGDNVLGLRLVPANFAQAAFGSQSGNVRDGRLTIHWWGYAIPYDRASPAADAGADVACADMMPETAMAGPAPVLAAAQSAPAPPDPAAGTYLSDMMETSSRLRLAPDGRFEWGFDVGALSLSSDGRWSRRDADTVLLTTDPARVPPRVELTGTGRDEQDGVAVALEGDSLEGARILEIESHYADGSIERLPMERIRRRVPSTPERPLVALRLGSEIYDFWSSRIPVETGAANVLSFRIAWNDLARVDFRSVPARLDGDALDFDWRGMTLSHRRADVAEADVAADGAGSAMTDMSAADPGGAELAVPIGPVPPHALTGDEPSIGRMGFAPGEPITVTRTESTIPFSDYDGNGYATGVAELRLRLGDLDRDLGRVSDLSWYVRSDGGPQRISALSFSPQDRLLGLDEALSRARNLADGLAQAGFVPGAPASVDWTDFRLIDPYRYEENVAGWETAAALLGDADASVIGMELFSVHKGRWYVTARVINLLRNGVRLENAQPGQEWVVEVDVTEDQEAGVADTAVEAE